MLPQATTLLLSLLLLSGPAAQQTTTATQPPPQVLMTDTVTVSARDTRVIVDALSRMKDSRDPMIAQSVSNNILRLVDAMSQSGAVNKIGPLSDQEADVVHLNGLLTKFSVAGGSIRLQPRNRDSTLGPTVFTLSRASFISLCADLASNGGLFRVNQELRTIVLARVVADLNEQQHNPIAEREVLIDLLAGFKAQDRKGVIIDRVLGIADAMANDAAENAPYDLVPAALIQDFASLGHMQTGVFEAEAGTRAGRVNVSYGGQTFSTSVDHFVWFFIRFMLAEDAGSDESVRARRTQLGGRLLDHLTLQLQVRPLERALEALDGAGVAGPTGRSLGDFIDRGPGLAAIAKAPGVSIIDSPRGPDYRAVVVSPDHADQLADLHSWLEEHTKKMQGEIMRRE